jgi:rhodanese-related sulfurtransferase
MRRLLIAAFAFSCFAFGQTQSGSQAHPQSPGFTALVKDAKTRIREVTVDDLKKMKASETAFTLIDVREDNEWTAEHIAGATHIGRGVLDRDIETKVPKKDAKLVVYCGGGSRSALAADILMKLGYTDVASLAGGIRDYKAAGLATEK